MANSPQARKRAKQNETRRQHNAALRSKMRTFVRGVRTAINAGEKEQAQEAFKVAVPVLDKMCGKGIIPKNTVARYKSRLNATIKAM
ncbi:MAG: 30S ribosomal protein S20 [Gammaproteobacteria bacterium]|nr:30S ribosomal protein S20 [Gammaproteobacteria bacterium]